VATNRTEALCDAFALMSIEDQTNFLAPKVLNGDKGREPPLNKAIRLHYFTMVETLLSLGADPNYALQFSDKPLDIAMRRLLDHGGSHQMVHRLLDGGACPTHSPRGAGYPLVQLIQKWSTRFSEGFQEADETLFHRLLALDPHPRLRLSFHGETLLHLACKYGAASYVMQLVEAGHSLVTRTGKQQDALYFALRSGMASVELLRIFVDKGLSFHELDKSVRRRGVVLPAKQAFVELQSLHRHQQLDQAWTTTEDIGPPSPQDPSGFKGRF
jgi:ankyrin repeat protein